MMKKKGAVLVLAMLVLFILGSVVMPAGVSAADTVKLTLISAYSKDRLWNKHLLEWVDLVAEKSKGRIKIQWRGGPEVVSPFENLAAVGKGTFDLVGTTPAYHPTVVPESTGLQLCIASPMEHRKLGSMALVDKAYQKRVNSKLIGMSFYGQGFGTLTVPKVSKLADLKGLKCRCVPQWVPVAKALGMSPVTLSVPETYSALEKGIADAVLFVIDPLMGEVGWYDHLKYVIRPNVHYGSANVVLMNLDKWNKLSKEDQEVLVDCMKVIEPESYNFFVTLTEKEIERMVSKGIKKAVFSEADAREYRRLQFQAMWKEFAASAPETAEIMLRTMPIPKELMPK
jgi:TRAP-type C4-dicarboxylate transport system substrate-binding protein